MSRKCSEKVDLKTNKKLFRKYLSKILPSYTNTKKVGFDLGKNESSFINLLEIISLSGLQSVRRDAGPPIHSNASVEQNMES
jgi:hypothetical protein